MNEVSTIDHPSTTADSIQTRRVDHLFDVAVAAIAEDLGVQTQALCGVWQSTNFGPGADLVDSWKPGGEQADDCTMCLIVADLRCIQICDPAD